MKPIDHRTAAWQDIQEQVTKLRLAALVAWRKHGPGTTREVARRAGMDLLTFRPRTTELYQLGFVVVVEQGDGAPAKEGVYAALTDDQAQRAFEARRAAERMQDPTHCQPSLL